MRDIAQPYSDPDYSRQREIRRARTSSEAGCLAVDHCLYSIGYFRFPARDPSNRALCPRDTMGLKTRKFDVAKFLETDADIARYLSEALETGDAAYVAHAFGAVARARGMAMLARQTGLGRESLYKALSSLGNPELATVLRVAKALGLELSARPKAARKLGGKSSTAKNVKRASTPRRAA